MGKSSAHILIDFEAHEHQAQDALRGFYEFHTVPWDDLKERYRFMKTMIVIPNYPLGQEPTLSELEIQWLRDQGYGL